MSMSDSMERLTKAVERLSGTDGDGSVEMSPEDFIAYAAGQIEKMADDEPGVKAERIAALKANVEAITKNFEGSPSTPGGILSVVQFRDPGQAQTTMKTVNAMNASAGPDNFSSNGEQAAVNGAGAAPTGQLAPAPNAAGSGFENPAAATFAKALEGLAKVLTGIGDETGASESESAPQTVEGETTDPKSVEKSEGSQGDGEGKSEPVAKAIVWPLDMNTPFGRGETDDPDEPEWGRDGAGE